MKSIKRLMFKWKLISLCAKLRLNTSNLIETFSFNSKFDTNKYFSIDLILIKQLNKIINNSHCNTLNYLCTKYFLNKSQIDWNVANLYFDSVNKFRVNKMKEILTTAACVTQNDVLLLDTNNLNNNTRNFTNGLSNGSKSPNIPKMAKIISGTTISKDIRHELKTQIEEWIANGHRAPHLTAVLIGEDPASHTYVKNKIKAAAEVGITSETKRIETTVTETELLELIEQLNSDDKVDGILVQLPLPEHINERIICDAICCNKDVDGFNEKNVGRLCLDINTLIPCTAIGVQELIKRSNIETFGKNAVVIGRSKNVGLPIFMLLHADGRNDTGAMDATVTMCHRFTPPEVLKLYCQNADIIVTATGIPGLITADMVKPGACVIDVGITRVTDEKTGKTKLVGDVDYEEVRKVAGHISPVPGGVGPMTVTMLMKNTLIAAKNLAKQREAQNKNGHSP